MADFDAFDHPGRVEDSAPPHTGWRPAAAERIAGLVGAARRRIDEHPWITRLALAMLVALLVALIVLLATIPKREDAARRRASVAVRTALSPDQPLPVVEPVVLLQVDPSTAREINAKVPFSTDPNLPARPYRTTLNGDDLSRAVDCLASAVLYEAGNDALGEAAVAQVVLNRVRHPAYPHSVCGVVYQGSERTTGCQFTFACDGALARIPRVEAWTQARTIALAALTGTVNRGVGLATHYHTDWVVPYWSTSLDKISELHTHLFYRWRGWWGTPPAFSMTPAIAEPRIAKLAFLSDVHKDPALLLQIRTAAAANALQVRRDGNFVLLALPATMAPDDFPAMAAVLCAKRDRCRVVGWSEAHRVPATGQPDAATLASASFVYTRDGAVAPVARWDCTRYARAAPAECMTVPASAIPGAAALAEVPAPAPAVADPSAQTQSTPEPAPPPKKRRIDPCRAFRNVDDRIGFCSGR